MSQALDSIPNDRHNGILYSYVNANSQIQIARITNIPNWYFERVVFPGQRLVFEAPGSAILEIHTGMMASAILSDTIPCTKLRLENTQKDHNQLREQPTVNIERSGSITLSQIEAEMSVHFAV